LIDLNPMFTAVRQAADLTRRVQQIHFGQHSEKAGREPVTIADYGSQAILLRAIASAYPGDAVLAEEHGDQFGTLLSDEQRVEIVRLVGDVLGEAVTEDEVKAWLDHGSGVEADRTWVIDPIDGTKGFIAMRRYSIAVGLLDRGLPIAGVLGSPGYPTPDGKGLLFHAQRGAAHVELMSGGKANRIAVSTRSRPRELRVVQSVERDHAHLELMARIYGELGIAESQVEGIDSQDKYAMIACGDAELCMRLPREAVPRHRSWDHAAGTALVQAAGGVVTDVDGSPLDFTTGAILTHNTGMVISNGAIHDRVLEVVQAAMPKHN
jgi:3'(2'), 5'-bisphosphate nucleotidase